MINILFEDNHLLVVEKPINLPVNRDETQDDNLLDNLKAFIKVRDNKPGNVYLGLVHRLDRPVGGVMVFAKTSKAASRLSEQIRKRQFSKTYLAIVNGKTPDTGEYTDKLLKDHQKNLVSIDPQGKEARLTFSTIGYQNDLSLVKIILITGRSHQIRVQFSYHNHPLWGDQKYNSQAKKGQQIALFASELSFIHPVTNQSLSFSCQPKNYPFTDFLSD